VLPNASTGTLLRQLVTIANMNGRTVAVFSHAGGSPYHGPNMRWYYLGAALLRRGHTVQIISSAFFHKYFRNPTTEARITRESIDGLDFVWVQTRKYFSRGLGQIINQLQYSWRAWLFAGTFRKYSADAVVASSPHPLVVFAAWRAARRSGARFVYEVRDLWPDALQQLAGLPSWHPYVILLRFAERFAVRRADCIVSVKPGDWEHFQRRYSFPANRVHFIANGFLPQRGTGAEPVAERGSSAFVVGYVGAMSAYYQLDTLLDAAALLRDETDIEFRLVGSGDDEERLRQRARDLNLNRVEFVGSVPKTAVPEYLRQFNACYVGLKDIGVNEFGISCNKLFEYMEAGKPVVACYNTRYDPVKYAGCGQTVASGDSVGVASAILSLRNNPALATQCGASGREYFSQFHDFGVLAERLECSLFGSSRASK